MKLLEWLFPRVRELGVACPACGALAGVGYTYCPVCSTRLDQRFIACPACRRTVVPTARFCPHCRAAIQPERAAREATTIVWKRQPGQFARKLNLNHQVFAREEVRSAGFLVEFGTRALVIVDGALAGELEPGRYPQYLGKDGDATRTRESEGVYDHITRAQRFVSVVLVQTTDQDLDFLFGLGKAPEAPERQWLLSRDHLPVGVDCQLTVRLTEAAAFYQNLMGAREVINVSDLKRHFYEELRDAFRQLTGRYEAEVLLQPDRATKDDLESELNGILRRSLQRAGLVLVQLRSIFVAQEQLQHLAEERGRVELERRRLEVRRQWLSLGNLERYAEAASGAELEKMLFAVDRERIIPPEEYAELRRAYEEGRGNRQLVIHALKARLELTLRVEYERLRLLEEGKLQLAEIDNHIARRRRELEFSREQQLRDAETQMAVRHKELELWKAKNQALLDMQRQQMELNLAAQRQFLTALGQLPPETAALWLAQNPESARVLVARAQAEGMQKVVEAYEKMLPQFKEMAVVAASYRGAVLADPFFPAGRLAVLHCHHCGCATVPPGARFCPTCGRELQAAPASG